MKILLANKFYYPRGGDCTYTLNLERLLVNHGHEVAIFAMHHPENISTPWNKYFPSQVDFSLRFDMYKAFLRPLGSTEVKKKFNSLLQDFSPDVIHLNNIHSQLSPIIAELAHAKGIRVVWTLHDLKLLCPRYDCLCKGKNICEKCFEDKKHVLLNKCLKNSFLASLIAYQEAKKWNRRILESYTDIFICPSNFIKNKMKQGNYSTKKLYKVHNFIDSSKFEEDKIKYNAKDNYYCYVGRLSPEKGIKTLLEVAQNLPYNLKIIGDGRLRKELEETYSSPSIDFLGYKTWEEVKKLVEKAQFLVTPSEWYENNPFSIIEAHCLGTPVLGANIGGIPELIEENVNGILFESRNTKDLREKITYCWDNFPRLINYNDIATTAQNKFSADKYYKKLMQLYRD